MANSPRRQSPSTRLRPKVGAAQRKTGGQRAPSKTKPRARTGDKAHAPKAAVRGGGAAGLRKGGGAARGGGAGGGAGTSVKMKTVGKTGVGVTKTGKNKAVGKQPGSDRKHKKSGETSAHAAAIAAPQGERGKGQATGKRKRKASMSLALEFTVPVCVMIGAVILVWGLIIGRRMQQNHLNAIKKNGASNVLALAKIGSRIMRDRREYGDKWPSRGGWVSDTVWESLVGKRPDGEEKIPAKTLAAAVNKARVLASLTFYRDARTNRSNANEVLDAYILTSSNNFVAGAYEFSGQVSIKDSGWFAGVSSTVKIGHNEISLGNVDVSPALVSVAGSAIKAFKFTCPVHDASGVEVGKALLALRGDVIETEQSALSRLMIGMGVGAMILAVVVCVFVATIVTKPAKTLIKDMDIVASGNLEHKTRAHSQDEIGQLAVEFNEMTRRLLIARKAEKEAERLENELDMAREIQQRLLPKRLPRVEGFDMDATYRPAREVGGDYYDFYLIATKVHLGIIVADVSGKSVPGAMQMATTRTILRFIAGNNTSAADTLAKTNGIVAQDIKRGMFVTAFYLVLNAKERSALCASAGHNPMVLVRASGKLELINPSGIALGFDKGQIFNKTVKEQNVQLDRGDRVVLYTDGVVEAMNANNEEYSNERFYDFCKRNRDMASKAFVAKLLADLDAHKGKAEQHDDITIVTFKVL